MELIQSRQFVLDANTKDNNRLWNLFLEAVHRSGATIFGTLKHEFYPHGLTGIVIIGESHVAIHTWPELNKVWVEFATCGDIEQARIFERELRRLLEE